MPIVSGSLKLVTGSPDAVSQVWLRAPNGRTQDGSYVTEAPDTIQVTGGAVSFDALPGALVMTLVSHGAPIQAVKLLVPDKTSATLAECIEAAELASDGTRNALERLALEVQAEPRAGSVVGVRRARARFHHHRSCETGFRAARGH